MDLNMKPLTAPILNPFPKGDNFLTAPASISFKKRGETTGYQSSVNCKGYAHLGFDKKGRIYFSVIGSTYNDDFRVVVSKWHLLQMLKFHLTLRPIRKVNDSKLWLNERQLSRSEMDKIDLESISFKELSEAHEEVKEKLEIYITRASPEGKKKAERQLQELVELQCKIEVLAGIEKTREILVQDSKSEIKKGKGQQKEQKLPELPKLPEYPELMEITGKWKRREKKKPV
ncbi:hypothetical protein MSMTP_2822 [Methanosarcina sp. MTP4]|uniref:hypothetical protein n=1 Tax=Methanosarcina sp. MTP4 TaxID=1434100 RepID=UPI000615F47E|nr:hypothetical protein [Methanosarcina sp. MTP4]AKB26291.1 hypothetical protein MSMTP_2822 [Methanosarcina sp. MTP4]